MRSARGITMLELMVSAFLVIIVLYGAEIVYLNFFSSTRRGTAKLHLQEDATQATEWLVRSFRYADSVSVSGSGSSLLIGTFDKGNPTATDCIYPIMDSYGRLYLAHNNGAGEEVIVSTPMDSLDVRQAGRVVRIALRLADTTGNKVTTYAAAGLRN
jgi:type II secretory pathway pseudopilin PulG